MKSKIILITMMVLLSNLAEAAWTKVTANEEATIYTDLSTVQKSGDTLKIWELMDLNKNKAGEGFLSSKSLDEIDCKMNRSRVVSYAMYSENMAGGKVVRSSDALHAWLPINDGGVAAFLSMSACKKN